ncbi:MAG TPA: SPOR domain-containing protein, partial [Candidatus Eisenbacteria bacterium]|nr:SPOR domain-containing protein [Candidatus Eisenbacteria bacterium]
VRADLPRGTASGGGRRGVWRVQLFASPDLAQADRIAKEASLRFGEPSVIEFEDSLYKVRLGAFPTEALAQSLRERAVQGGFPGAFRMWSTE